MEHVSELQSEVVDLLLRLILAEHKYSSTLVEEFAQRLQTVLERHDTSYQQKSVLRKDLESLIAEIKAVHGDLCD